MAWKRAHKIWLFFLILTLLLVAYSWFFRTFLDSEQYLQLAYDYTGRDQHIINWREPDFEIINYRDRLTIHIIFHTSEDSVRGPISLYIDPFRKTVVEMDPRLPATEPTTDEEGDAHGLPAPD